MRKEIIGRHVADSALPALVDHVLLHLGVESLEFGVRGWELVVGGVGQHCLGLRMFGAEVMVSEFCLMVP